MKRTVEEIKKMARLCLGESGVGKTFNDEYLGEWFSAVLEELYQECLNHQIPGVEVITTATLTSGGTSFDPYTDGSLNFGELISLEERASGSSDKYREVHIVETLPQRDAESYLYVAEWRGEVYYFVGATQDIQLRIDYYSSGGDLDDDDVVALDGAQNFLAYRLAALAGPGKGFPELAKHWDTEARGRNPDRFPGGALHRFLKAPVRSLQRNPIQQSAYTAGGNQSIQGGRPPHHTTD
jgi:hypothetical protein